MLRESGRGLGARLDVSRFANQSFDYVITADFPRSQVPAQTACRFRVARRTAALNSATSVTSTSAPAQAW